MNNPYNAPTADMSTQGDSSQTYQPRVFDMKGRIGRVRYIAYSMGVSMVLLFVLAIVAGLLIAMTGAGEGAIMLVTVLVYIPLIIVAFMMAIRRVHDMGHSGWMSLLILVPIANLWLLFAPGTQGANEYGPAPVKNTTGVILAAFSPILLSVVFGILAAIAIPAYQGYVMKAKAAQEESAPVSVEAAPE